MEEGTELERGGISYLQGKKLFRNCFYDIEAVPKMTSFFCICILNLVRGDGLLLLILNCSELSSVINLTFFIQKLEYPARGFMREGRLEFEESSR